MTGARPTSPLRIGFLVFPDVMQLDLTGPHEVLSQLPDSVVHLIWKDTEPVRASSGMRILPDTRFEDCPPLDVICVPGGGGVGPLLEDGSVLAFLRDAAGSARFVTSVCTGSLVLGAAGLLRGRRAACHWLSRDLLTEFGATPVALRVVRDGNLITGGGVTAGIDFGLALVAELRGDEAAQAIQLQIEYDPDPPFAAGSPDTAPAAIVQRVRAATTARQAERARRVARAAAALKARA
ncbi:DJ-1/PfpI family protein [Marinivivus vitaminiproducens]|uniref:DJ-1/PfpI family protein n=1 Tax=Marinivivus vitaminiproducens TaxID=3035935 RepID=UPI00279F6BFB|nr:DJ-1/PfpI family protein [Geminicoccaceae bacterium SCSIO 64248]